MTLICRPTAPARPTAPLVFPDTARLRPYQAEGARWLRARSERRANSLLADEMGLGKTAQALHAIAHRGRAIVVCPASVALTWEDEVARWRPDLRVVDLADRAPRESEICLSSYDGLPDIDEDVPWLIPDDLSQVTLVVDEAHRCRNGSAERTAKIRRLVQQCDVTWALTGTPMSGTPRDLRGVLVTFGLMTEAFGTHAEFKRLCAEEDEEIYVRKLRRTVTRTRWGEISSEVRERLARSVMLRRLREGLVEIPPVQWIEVPCPAPSDLRDHLDALSRKWETMYNPKELPPFELYSEATAALARSRAEIARELAEEVARERQVIVFSAHLDPIREVSRAGGAVSITGEEPSDRARRRSLEKFMNGSARILGMTIEAGGTGLNVQAAGAVILVDENFLPTDTDQAIDRAVRPGNCHDKVVVYRMTTTHPLDRRIREIHDEKRRMIRQAVGMRR